jgi:hypothetical protein
MLYRTLCGIDGAIGLIVFGFFLAGLADGSVSSFNIGLWLILLAGVAVIIGGGVALNANGRPRLASAVLAILAWPGFLVGLFFLAVLLLPGRWN